MMHRQLKPQSVEQYPQRIFTSEKPPAWIEKSIRPSTKYFSILTDLFLYDILTCCR